MATQQQLNLEASKMVEELGEGNKQLNKVLEETLIRLVMVSMENDRSKSEADDFKRKFLAASSMEGERTNKIYTLEKQLEERNKNIMALKTRIGEQDQELTGFRAKMRTMEQSVIGMGSVSEENARIARELAQTKTRYTEVLKGNEELNHQVRELHLKLNDGGAKVSEFEGKIKLLASENQRLTLMLREVETEKENYRLQVNGLSSEISRITTEFEQKKQELVRQIQEYKIRLEHDGQQSQESEKRIANLSSQLEALNSIRENYTIIEKKNRELEITIEERNNQVAEIEDSYNKVKLRMDTMGTIKANLEEDLSNMRKDLETQSNNLRDITDKKNDLERKIRMLAGENTRLVTEFESLSSELQNRNQRITELENLLRERENNITSQQQNYKNQIEQLTKTNQELSSFIQESQQKVAYLEEQLNITKSTKREFEERIKLVTAENDKIVAALRQRDEDAKNAQHQLEGTLTSQKEIVDKASRLENQIRMLAGENERLRLQLQELQGEKDNIQNKVNVLENQIRMLAGENQRLQSVLKEFEEEKALMIKKFQMDMQSKTEAYDKAQNQLRLLSGENQRLQNLLREKEEELEAFSLDYKKEVHSLRLQLEEAENSTVQTDKLRAKFNKEIERITIELNASHSEVTKLKKRNSNLEETIAQLQDQVQSIQEREFNLNEMIKELQEDLETARNEVFQKETEINKRASIMNSESQSLSDKLKLAQQELDEFRRKERDNSSQLKITLDENNRLQEILKRKDVDYSEAQSKMKLLANDHDRIQSVLNQRESEIANLRSMKERVEEFSHKSRLLAEDNDRLHSLIREKDGDILRVRDEKYRIEQDYAENLSRLRQITTEKESIQRMLQDKENEMEINILRLVDYQRRGESVEDETRRLRNEKEKLSDQLHEATLKLASANSKISQLETKTLTLIQASDSQKEAMNKFEAIITSLKHENTNMTRLNARVQSIEERDNLYSTLTKQASSLQSTLEEERSKNARAISVISDLKEKIIRSEEDLARYTILKSEYTELRKQFQHLSAKYSLVYEENKNRFGRTLVEEDKGQSDEWRAQYARLEDTHQRFLHDFNSSKNELERLRQKTEDQEQEISEKSLKINRLMMRIVCCTAEIERLRS